MPKSNKRIINTLFMVSSIETIEKTAARLSLQARQAYTTRDFSRVLDLSEKLLLLAPAYEPVGEFYKALAFSNSGKIVFADSIFEGLTHSENLRLRAASLLALGMHDLQNEKIETATRLISESHALALSENICAPLTAINAQSAMAMICGISGDSQQALKLLKSVEPLVKSVSSYFPAVMGQHINALAYENLQLGNIESASHLINKATSLSISAVYPEWLETGREIKDHLSDKAKVYIPYRRPDCLTDYDEFQARKERAIMLAEAAIVPSPGGLSMPYPCIAVYISGERFGVIPLPDDRDVACLIMNTFLSSLEEISSRPEDRGTATIGCYFYTEVSQKHVGTEQILPEHFSILEKIIEEVALLEESHYYDLPENVEMSEEEVERIFAYVKPMLENQY